jgi:hypothetical protein
MRVRYAFAALTLFAAALPVRGAVDSFLSEVGSTFGSPNSVVQDFDKRDMEPVAHVNLSSAGDEAMSVLKLTGSEGMMTLNTHACSGPPINTPNAGQAGASGTLNYFEDFTIVSATLPVGTPVTINVKIAAGSSFRAVTDPNFLNDYANSNGSTGIRIDTLSTTDAAFSGSFGANGGNAPNRSQTGIFASSPPTASGDRRAGEFTAIVGGLVGGKFHFTIHSQLSDVSGAGNPRVSDADGQISILWGADVVGGLASILANSDSMPFPSMDNATSDRALQILPPGIPEPTGLALILPGLLLLGRRRAAAP